MYGEGIGKERSKLGRFLDRNKLTQGWLAKISGVSRNEISRLSDGEKFTAPRAETVQKIISALRKNGYDVRVDDFWG